MKANWFQDLTRRLTWATKIIVLPGNNPVIRLDNGITLDLVRNKIILDGDFALHVTGNLDLSADGDILLRSGKALGHQTGDLLMNVQEPVAFTFPADSDELQDQNGNVS